MIYTKIYDAPKINEKEILRYAASPNTSDETRKLLDICIAEAKECFSYRVCYGEFDISQKDEILGVENSKTLSGYLEGCISFVLFGATVGAEIDRKIAREIKISPAKAYMLNAFATERIESLCDMFCRELSADKAKEILMTKPRISPGYGDMPLKLQRDIFSVLDCPRKIGVSLGESMLMTPRKSVTAIVGVYDR